MKTGTQDRKKIIILAALLAVAGVLLWRQFASSGPGAAPVGPAADAVDASLPNLARLETRLRLGRIERLRQIRYKGSRRDLFVAGPNAMTRLADARHAAAPPPTPPPPPRPSGPPPIPMKFYGYARRAGVPQRVFLQYGDKVFIVHVGESIAGRFQIISITPTSVEVRDLTSQQTQFLP